MIKIKAIICFLLILSFIICGCNSTNSKDYIQLYDGNIYCSLTDYYVDTDTQIGRLIEPVYTNDEEIIFVSKVMNYENGEYDFYKLCFLNTKTYQMREIDVKEYLLCSNYPDITFSENMKILEPGAIDYQDDILYFTAEVNKNQAMLFIVNTVTGDFTHSESVKFFGSKIVEVSEDGKYVYVTVPKEQDIDLKEGNVYNILAFDTEQLEFNVYKEGAQDLQFSPDYKYMAYVESEIITKTNEKGAYFDSGTQKLVVKDMVSDEIVYELNPIPQSSKIYRFSADSKGILCFETQFRSVITGSQGRYVGIYIDLTKGTKKKLFTGKWGEELGEVIIIGNSN